MTRSVQSRVVELLDELPAAQHAIAELLVRDPEAIAFGTTETVAEAAGTSGPTVVRLAVRLGFEGYAELRDQVRRELSDRLRSASERLRTDDRSPLLDRVLEVERANVEQTVAGLDAATVDAVADLLADTDRRVHLVPSSQFAGLGRRLADELSLIRRDVHLVEGSEFRVRTELAGARPGDVILTIDVQRHEAWLVRTQRGAVAAGMVPVVVTDRLPCSLELAGGHALTFAANSAHAFESQVGATVVLNALVAAVVDRRRSGLAGRVEALERLWVDEGLFEF